MSRFLRSCGVSFGLHFVALPCAATIQKMFVGAHSCVGLHRSEESFFGLLRMRKINNPQNDSAGGVIFLRRGLSPPSARNLRRVRKLGGSYFRRAGIKACGSPPEFSSVILKEGACFLKDLSPLAQPKSSTTGDGGD